MKRYTKADLEKTIYLQLENLEAMHDLLTIMKVQNQLLHKTNEKLRDDISGLRKYPEKKPVKKKRRSGIKPPYPENEVMG